MRGPRNRERDIIDRSIWQPRDVAYLGLCLLLTVFAVAPLTYPGYPLVHTGFLPHYELNDLIGRHFALSWTPHLFQPFDPLRADGLLPYHLAGVVVWLGTPPLAALRAVFGLGVLLGAAGMFVWLRRVWGGEAGLLGALVYTYLPYHLAAYLVRGNLGESLLLGLLPWGFWAVLTPRHRSLSSLLFGGSIWLLLGFCQLGLALLASVVVLFWFLARRFPRSQPGTSWLTALAAVAGIAVAATATLALAGSVAGSSHVHFDDHFLFVSQLFSPVWGFGASLPGWNDDLSLGYGLAAAGLAMLAAALALAAVSKRSTEPGRPEEQASGTENPIGSVAIAVGSAILLSIFTFQISAPLWKLSGADGLLTYPWQLLAPIGLCLSVAAAATVHMDASLTRPPALAVLVAFVLLAAYPCLEPRATQLVPPATVPPTWGSGHLSLLATQLGVTIPQSSAGLSQATPGRVPLADYGPVEPGDTLFVDLTWQATRPMTHDLKLFVHLLDRSGNLVAQVDPPAGMRLDDTGQSVDYPSSQWAPGELVLTQVELPIPLSAPPGPYHLALGLYDSLSLQRFPLPGHAEDSLIADVDTLGERRE